MKRVVVIVEGPTEERFVKDLLAEALWPCRVLLTPIILGVPGHRGGRVNYARVERDLIGTLKQDRGVYCSTMLDFYALGKGFPGASAQPGTSSLDRVRLIEQAIKDDIHAKIPEYRSDERLIPYLSLHEFEGLLFSDPDALAQALGAPGRAPWFHEIRNEFPTPEDINDGRETAPSKRIVSAHPGYRKVIQGTRAARAVGIDRMRRECGHFRWWIEQMEKLPEL